MDDMIDSEFNSINFDGYILLPLMRDITFRIANGKVDKKTFNYVVALYRSIPAKLRNQINVNDIVKYARKKSELKSRSFIFYFVTKLFEEIKSELDSKNFLRDQKRIQGGSL
jgi:hypothetical protein